MSALSTNDAARWLPPQLETPRLVLRTPHADDAPAIAALLNNPAVSGNLARVPHPYTLADACAYLRARPAQPAPEETTFSIDLPGQGAIGQIGFHRNLGEPVLGYWLGEPFWGQGLMSEAAKAVVDWFFRASCADHIRSGVFHFNMASLAIQHKLGFVETGRSIIHCLARHQDVEHIDTELTRDDHEALRP